MSATEKKTMGDVAMHKGPVGKKGNSRAVERWALLLSFVSTAITGLGLHMAGHGGEHEAWHNWAVAHIVSGLVWLIAAIVHIKRHWPWYKMLVTKGLGKKSKVTLFLSLVFLAVVVTGIVLLVGVDGANSGMGLWHYKLGLLLIVMAVWHIVMRRKVFFSSGKKGVTKRG